MLRAVDVDDGLLRRGLLQHLLDLHVGGGSRRGVGRRWLARRRHGVLHEVHWQTALGVASEGVSAVAEQPAAHGNVALLHKLVEDCVACLRVRAVDVEQLGAAGAVEHCLEVLEVAVVERGPELSGRGGDVLGALELHELRDGLAAAELVGLQVCVVGDAVVDRGLVHEQRDDVGAGLQRRQVQGSVAAAVLSVQVEQQRQGIAGACAPVPANVPGNYLLDQRERCDLNCVVQQQPRHLDDGRVVQGNELGGQERAQVGVAALAQGVEQL